MPNLQVFVQFTSNCFRHLTIDSVVEKNDDTEKFDDMLL